MSLHNPDLRMSLLATSIALSLMNTGCGGAEDTAAAVTEAAVASADATTLEVDETSKRLRDLIRSRLAVYRTTRTAEPVPTATVSTTPTTTTTTTTTTASIPNTTTSTSTISSSTAPISLTSTAGSISTAGIPTVDQRIAMDAALGYVASGAIKPVTGTYLVAANPVNAPSGEFSNLPLIYPQNLERIGAFSLPNPPAAESGQDICAGFAYGAIGLAFNPAGDNGKGTLIATGHPHCSRVGEIKIPNPVDTKDFGLLPRATFSENQPNGQLVDALEGGLATSGITGGGVTLIQGLHVWGNRLIITAANDYAGQAPVSHWSRPLDLNKKGQVSPPSAVSAKTGDYQVDQVKLTAGYMCDIPTELQSALKGPVFTGLRPDASFEAIGDVGVTLYAFNPDLIASGNNVLATPLLFSHTKSPLQQTENFRVSNIYNWGSKQRGCALPSGTRSVFTIGRHGYGAYAYGAGGANGYMVFDPATKVYDPVDESVGSHAWPYRYQVWAYDAAQIARAQSGDGSFLKIQPYAVWALDLPYVAPENDHYTGGIAYDPKTRRLFLVQHSAGPYGQPVIHVFTVNNAVAR